MTFPNLTRPSNSVLQRQETSFLSPIRRFKNQILTIASFSAKVPFLSFSAEVASRFKKSSFAILMEFGSFRVLSISAISSAVSFIAVVVVSM